MKKKTTLKFQEVLSRNVNNKMGWIDMAYYLEERFNKIEKQMKTDKRDVGIYRVDDRGVI